MLWQQDNILHGRYLAELTKEVLVDLEASKYQHAEYRISIYGRKYVEWDILAAWYCQNKLYSDNVLWLIQVRKKRKDYTFRRCFNEKPGNIPGCPNFRWAAAASIKGNA